MSSTTAESAEESGLDDLPDAKIIVGGICGVTFLLITITIAVCCSLERRTPRRKRRRPPPQPQSVVVPLTIQPGNRGQPAIIVINNNPQPPQNKSASLPGYTNANLQNHHTRPGPSPNQGQTTARAQANTLPQPRTQPRPQAPANKQNNKNVRPREFRMSRLEDKPNVEANKYIKFEVPAPAEQERRPSAAVPVDSRLEEISKYITRAITKVLQAISIPSERIQKKDVLGAGQFGVVFKGELSSEDYTRKIFVALKTVAGDTQEENDIQEFMDEVLRMKNFSHIHVMPMLGMTIMDNKPYMVMPFMKNGDLRSYISDPTRILTVEDLLKTSMDVTRGMEYLAAQNIIHGDLAARNCMVGEDEAVKVADFGLSRHLFQSDYYSLDQSEALRPFRWMAPECIFDQKFSVKSDVWSFGILLWEIMTRGQKPYPDMKTNMEVMDQLGKQYRMPCPTYCAIEIHEVMMKCWDQDAHNRPNFKDVTHMIELLLEEAGGDYEKPIASPNSGSPLYT